MWAVATRLLGGWIIPAGGGTTHATRRDFPAAGGTMLARRRHQPCGRRYHACWAAGSPLWAAVPRLPGGGNTPLLPAVACLLGSGITPVGGGATSAKRREYPCSGGTMPARRRDQPCGRRCRAYQAAGTPLLPAVPCLLGGGINPVGGGATPARRRDHPCGRRCRTC